jgi:hypothetical protein
VNLVLHFTTPFFLAALVCILCVRGTWRETEDEKSVFWCTLFVTGAIGSAIYAFLRLFILP